MFSKILIANRGEIAVRILKTCKKMGIKTVAIYSEVDRTALHVEQADEAVLIGPAPASQSYLCGDRIVEIAKNLNVEAIHPGYGFLSENFSFAQRVEDSGLRLIGPSSSVIKKMGDKLKAREAALACGMFIVPGSPEAIETSDQALSIAQDIGYPIMIKAAAGGGGKGMRIAFSAEEMRAGLEASQREALSSFADSRVFLEKFIEKPRHIEVQVLADNHGTFLHLGERECSLQRRHQKVIEESPSPFISEKVRQEMVFQALNLARFVHYTSAGTVEFIVDQHQNFYFLEMNTRLQVEHAVTELVTGRDLVEDMIRIAAGEKLNIHQTEIFFQGHAVEARVYAEDPTLNFIPSPGKLQDYIEPPSIRVDSGVEEGDEISLHYDPMISKVISHASTRLEAFEALSIALNQYKIQGLVHNIPFLSRLCTHPQVLLGEIHTNFIAEHYPQGFDSMAPPPEDLDSLFKETALLLFSQRSPSESVLVKRGEILEKYQLKNLSLTLKFFEKNIVCVEAYDRKHYWFQGTCSLYQIHIMGYGYEALFEVYPSHFESFLRFSEIPKVTKVDPSLRTPMPGKLIKLMAREGDKIKRGQSIAVVEAMKMENTLKAPHDGVIKKLLVKEGEILDSKQKILEIAMG